MNGWIVWEACVKTVVRGRACFRGRGQEYIVIARVSTGDGCSLKGWRRDWSRSGEVTPFRDVS